MAEVKEPERIWLDLKSDSEVWTSCEKDAFSQDVCFIRSDLHDDLVKAADALALSLKDCMETLLKPDDRICCSGYHCGCYGATHHQQSIYYATEALTAYRKARGDTQ